jgi:hypothetical protein
MPAAARVTPLDDHQLHPRRPPLQARQDGGLDTMPNLLQVLHRRCAPQGLRRRHVRRVLIHNHPAVSTAFFLLSPLGSAFSPTLSHAWGASTAACASRDAWNSKRNLLKVLRSVDLQWMGSDENVQGVLLLVAWRPVPIRTGTLNLGYLDADAGSRWVTPDGVLGPAGELADEDIVFVPSGASLYRRVAYRPPQDPAVEAAAAAVILARDPGPQCPRCGPAILGRFFAVLLKPRIQEAFGHFRILMVWGSAGSGKSSIVMEVFWPLFGVVSAEPYSATATEFALLKLLSATNSVPVFIDEYKPFDMPRHRRNALHCYMRRLYTGEVKEQGRADQTLVTCHPAAWGARCGWSSGGCGGCATCQLAPNRPSWTIDDRGGER